MIKIPGGKRWLASRIIALLPPHVCYVEPFGGGAAVLLAKPPSKIEVYNDVDSSLVNFFRMVKYHPDELELELSCLLNSRAEYRRWMQHPGVTDIQRAAQWYVSNAVSFGGSIIKGYGVQRVSGGASSGSRRRRIERIAELNARFDRVNVEHLDWARCIDLYDGPDTVFFLDPPYPGTDPTMYRHFMSMADHRALAARIKRLRGRWVLTYGEHALARELYGDCTIRRAARRRTINMKSPKIITELIITPRTRKAGGGAINDRYPAFTPCRAGAPGGPGYVFNGRPYALCRTGLLTPF